MAPQKNQLKIYGLIKEAEFYQAKVTAEGLAQKYHEEFEEPMCKGMIEHNWKHFLHESKQKYSGELWSYDKTTLVILNNEVIGSATDFLEWASNEHDFRDFRPLPLFYALAKEEYKEYLKKTQHDYVYLDISIGDQKVGLMMIELFNDLLPKTCENFKQLCIGDQKESEKHDPALALSYKNTLFHRVVKNGWIQGGDIVQGRGDNGWSIYGDTFADENYAINHSRRGLLGMANKGRHSNASQFYFTLQPAPWMDCQYVAFGEIVEGLDILDALENVDTYNERPKQDCKIVDCGVIDINKLYT